MSTKETSRRTRNNDQGAVSTRMSSLNYSSTALVGTARDKAFGVAQAARDFLTPSSFPDWTAPLTHLESLTTVMFSPLAAHPVYQSESLARALQLMQQQQRQRTSSSQSGSTVSSELVLQGARQAWPSSSELLKAEIPESNAPLSLFQGFAATYPSLANSNPAPTSHKRSRNRRKKHGGSSSSIADGETGRSLTQKIADREQKMRESNKLQKQKSSTANEINQINMQIEELVNKRKSLETKWAKLEAKEQQLLLTIDALNGSIVAVEEDGRDSDAASSRTGIQDEADSEDEIYERGTCYKTLEGHADDVLCVDFNHPKGILVSSSMDGTVRAWDLHRNRCLGSLEGHTSLVRCMQLDNACLLTGSEDGSIKQWNLTAISPAPTPSSTSSAATSAVSSGRSSPELASNDDNMLPVLNDCCVGNLEGHHAEVTALFSDQTMAVSGANDKTMKQWDLETQQCVLTLDVMWASNSAGSGSSSSGWRAMKSLDQWSLDGLHSFFEPSNFVGALQFWNFALASGTIDGKLRMWDLRTGQAHRTLPGHTGPITCLQFDEVHLVSGSADKTIRIWDLRTGSVFDTLNYSCPVSSLQFDASRIISSNTTENIDIYNRTSFQHTTLQGHTGPVNSVRFRDGVLASGSSDGVVKLWAL
ncbi:WD40-repeat-containing domain protein [Zychaea mexicana]|uniref:WD40-repeat-containing domain protein n=1 Tax=Zychaea mexicana TaxID=64656 RepID=UPI0022FDB1D3|nr:WD40-repeat-containing domain protein [Zychaea mexicana]KAI9499357.1 WD40-repeat-containing domain protein [Zychaea mexicana]